jgi:hypothetical protein
MPKTGNYCKAYPVWRFREYKKWREIVDRSPEEQTFIVDGQAKKIKDLADDSFLYLHDTLNVTHGIFVDENVVFNDITEEWREFCSNTLQFEIPPQT